MYLNFPLGFQAHSKIAYISHKTSILSILRMTDHCRHYPVEIITRIGQCNIRKHRGLCIRIITPVFQGFFVIIDRARHDKLFPCSSQGNIKDSQLLSLAFLQNTVLYCYVWNCIVTYIIIQINTFDTNAHFLADNNIFSSITGIETAAHIANCYYRKFKSLALMNSHNADYILIFS